MDSDRKDTTRKESIVIAKQLSIVALCGLVAACATDAASDNDAFATLMVEPDRVSAGGQITLTLTNRSDRQLGYNLCPVAIERRDGDEWELRPEQPAEACTMELRILQPGSEDTFQHTVPTTIPAGTYRFRAQVEWPLGDEQVNIASETFEVEE